MWDWPSSVLLKTIWPPLTALRWSVSRSWGWPGLRPAARPGRGQTRRGKSSHYWGANIFFYRYFIFYHWAGLWVAVALEWDCWQFYTLMTWWGSELPHHSQVTPRAHSSAWALKGFWTVMPGGFRHPTFSWRSHHICKFLVNFGNFAMFYTVPGAVKSSA